MWSYLISVNTEIEADIINGLLDEAQIPVQKKYPGGLKASYGIINGVELWIPSDSIELAHKLLNLSSENIEGSNDYPTSKRFSKPVLLSFIIVLFILFFVFINELTQH